MRKNRVIEKNRCYHLVSRLAYSAIFLDDEEKDRAVALMRRVEEFSGVVVLAYAFMSNHFHIFIYVPSAEEIGDRYSVSAGQRRIVWDPLLTSYTNRSVLADLEITLSAESVDEKRYLIIDMTEGAVNATGAKSLVVDVAGGAEVEFVDVFGNRVSADRFAAGLHRLDVPASGYAIIKRHRSL